MKLKSILENLITERRTKKINLEAAKKYFNDYVQDLWHPTKNTQIYRGVIGFESDFGFVDPKSAGRRKSKNTQNYYTLMIDNFDSWSQYPERSLSLVCTTDANYAASMGEMDSDGYIVLPIKSGIIGVCSDDDLWRSFNMITGNFPNIRNLNQFNNILYTLSNFVLGNSNIPEDDFQEFKNHIDKIEKEGRENGKFEYLLDMEFDRFSTTENKTLNFISEFLSSKKSLIDYLKHLLDPEKTVLVYRSLVRVLM